MTIAEWLSKMTIGEALRVAMIVAASIVISVPIIRLQLKRAAPKSSVPSRRPRTQYIAGVLTGLLLFVAYLYLLRNHVTVPFHE
ncbi:hypothetical protein [Paraburkholderia bannensis]|uniref:hypothetical protein n=1 Tax=Paraburkholderia bannensis TaxID=765414 RepID=UPI002ABD5E2F|nr:hypothetical protein [Paraburkholderia bannensis]